MTRQTPLHRAFTATAAWIGHPVAFLVLALFVGAWWLVEHDTLDWHGWATVVAIAMTIFIQRAQNRDTAALQAKLDELILATEGARDEMTGVHEKEPDEIEAARRSGSASVGERTERP